VNTYGKSFFFNVLYRLPVPCHRLVDQTVDAHRLTTLPVFQIDVHTRVYLTEDQKDHIPLLIHPGQEQPEEHARLRGAVLLDQVVRRGLRDMLHQERRMKDEGPGMAVADGVDDAGIEQLRPRLKDRVEQRQKGVFENHVPEGEIYRPLMLQPVDPRQLEPLR